MAGIHISQEIFAIDVLTALKLLFGVTSEACSAIVTTKHVHWQKQGKDQNSITLN